MRRLLVVLILAGGCLVAPSVAGASPGATVTQYHASYPCPCFGSFDLSGVHLTNKQFPGVDNGPTSSTTTGGRDNFSGTVTEPPSTTVTFTGPGGSSCDASEAWYSDYNPNLTTCTYSETINPDGTVEGWAVYPDTSN